jgi:hypothetical protein
MFKYVKQAFIRQTNGPVRVIDYAPRSLSHKKYPETETQWRVELAFLIPVRSKPPNADGSA